MRILLAALLCAAAALGGTLRFHQSKFEGAAEGWTTWSARPETMPRTYVDAVRYRSEQGSLAISGNSNSAEHGGWERLIPGVAPGAWYRLTAYYRANAVPAETWQVVARLDWKQANGRRAGQPDYAYRATRDGDWTRLEMEVPAPEKATGAVLQLYLSNAPQGTVWWDDITVESIAAPAARTAVVAAINLRPSGADGVRQFIETIERAITQKTDVILLPEGITLVGTGKTYAEVAETVPGPTTLRLGEVARKRNSYLVAGIYEREAQAIYNTSILLDRGGALVGKYRKVYLPREEIERGLTPGDEFPTFRTDFGQVGMMICYDVFFSDPAYALAAQGAELILMPIWGGDEALGKARAIENRVFLATSGYDYPTYVMDPDGEILSQARDRGQAAITTVDLNRRYTEPHLGDMRGRRMKEKRVDVRQPLPGLN